MDLPRLPWKPRTRQQQGLDSEKKLLRDEGMRVHPASGAGHIKHDGSDARRLGEVKLTSKSFTLSASYLHGLMTRAIRQEREPVMFVEFDDPKFGCIAEITIRPRRRT